MKNPIKQFIIHWKEHGLKQTLKDLRRNFLLLQTPELINKQKIQGTFAMFFGLIFIFVVLAWAKTYYTLVAIGAGIFMSYIGLKQLYDEKEAMNMWKEQSGGVE